MVILRTRNKITDFLMILAWASPFKIIFDQSLQTGKLLDDRVDANVAPKKAIGTIRQTTG